ncbi:MAG: hypothetical protein HYZ27_05115, partial [Deltaproteobacteria bacterium]|nr:hypothetical protein [Deltaproteobacteria bacterium]
MTPMRLAAFPLGLFCFVACHETPTLDGVPLACNSDDDCTAHGEEWRCFHDVCVRNGKPVVADLSSRTLVLGNELVVTATATDDEKDDLSFAWTQTDGPLPFVLSAPSQSTTLRVTPLALGVHIFVVVARDAYSTSDEVTLVVAVQPAATTLYVSDTADPTVATGTFDKPYREVADGLAALHAAGPGALVVAAVVASDHYTACLDLRQDESLLGGFANGTWEWDDYLREQTLIACNAPAGHTLRGNAYAQDVTLGLESGVVFTAGAPLVTVTLAGGAPTLASVDVETSACGI